MGLYSESKAKTPETMLEALRDLKFACRLIKHHSDRRIYDKKIVAWFIVEANKVLEELDKETCQS